LEERSIHEDSLANRFGCPIRAASIPSTQASDDCVEPILSKISLEDQIDYIGGTRQAPAGRYKILVGESSEQIELTGEIKLAKTVTEKP
jgi:hypothetical protein